MKEGVITKGVGGFYDVLVDGDIIRCRARGIFRKDNIIPMIGDRVMVSIQDKRIIEILKRKNQLARPAVANIDLLGLVTAVTHPDPDFYLLDKLMINAEYNGIDVLLLINKIDLAEKETVDEIIDEYRLIKYPIITLSCKEGLGFDQLKKMMKSKLITLAGQSGVGKSSIINVLNPENVMEIGELSGKINRGKHTTRHTMLLPLPSGGMLVDTPGFSTMNMGELMPEDLPYYYTDFSDYSHGCRFNGCIHDKEPGCRVKEAVSQGLIPKGRYQRYIGILNELREFRRDFW